MTNDLNLPRAKDLRRVPTDETVTSVIIDLTITTWSEVTKDQTKKQKLSNPNGRLLIIKYDANGFIRSEKFPIDENPTTTSRYGRLLLKYNVDEDPEYTLKVGDKIKVLFDGEGKSEIILKK